MTTPQARPLDSRIGEVIVFRSGALVTRTAALAPDAAGVWPEEIGLGGLPLTLDEGSVRLRLEPAGEGAGPLPAVTDVRVEWVVPPLGEPIEPPSDAELREAAERVASLSRRLAAIAAEEENLGRLDPSLADRFEDRPPRPLSADVLAGVADWSLRAGLSRAAEAAKLREEQREAGEAQARLQRRAAEARAERGVDEERVCKRVVARLRTPPGASTQPVRLVLEYRVPGAGWRPTYVVRVRRDGKSASLGVRALVAQQSGEPWAGVGLVLSTADLARRIALPQLKSQRIGRQQPEPAAKGWREAPIGAENLFESLDQTLAARRDAQALLPPPPPPAPPPMAKPSFAPPPEEDDALEAEQDESPKRDEERSADKKAKRRSPIASGGPPPGAPPPMAKMIARPMAMPMRSAAPAPQAAMAAPAMSESATLGGAMDLMRDLAEGGGSFGAAPPQTPSGASPPQGDYHRLRLGAWDAPAADRGHLRPLTQREQLEGLTESQAARALQLGGAAEARTRAPLPFPVTTTAVERSAGSFDYSFRATGRHDVPADGKPHNLPLFAKEGPVELTLVVVPRESDQAVRVAALKNPLGAPLLAGPVDLYLEDEFLVASQLPTQPVGGTLQLGLGVEPALKVARNAHFKEATGGLLGGKLALRHDVEIEIASRLPAPVLVEVRERLPIYLPDDGEVSIDLGEVAPAWEPFDQPAPDHVLGGHRWRFALAPAASQKLTYGYTVRIDSKNELRGGNRRE